MTAPRISCRVHRVVCLDMLRVFGDAELYVDAEFSPGRHVVVLGPGRSRVLVQDAVAAQALVDELQHCEWVLEGADVVSQVASALAGSPLLLLTLDLDLGRICLVGTDLSFTAVQSEHLRSLLTRAIAVVTTGVGDMEEHA